MNFWVAPDPKANAGAGHSRTWFFRELPVSGPNPNGCLAGSYCRAHQQKSSGPTRFQDSKGSFEKICLRTSFSLYAAGLNGG